MGSTVLLMQCLIKYMVIPFLHSSIFWSDPSRKDLFFVGGGQEISVKDDAPRFRLGGGIKGVSVAGDPLAVSVKGARSLRPEGVITSLSHVRTKSALDDTCRNIDEIADLFHSWFLIMRQRTILPFSHFNCT